jgi:hypothetical protein
LLAAARAALLALKADVERGGAARRWFEAGVFGALAVLVRLPSLVALAPLAILVSAPLWRKGDWRGLPTTCAFALPFAPALAFSAWYNHARFGNVFDDGHRLIAANHLSSTPWAGVLGLLISPGKGIIWYCPLVLAAAYLAPEFYRERRAACLIAFSVALSSLVPYALLNDWYGGAAWGPRYFMPVLPLLFLPLLAWPGRPRAAPARFVFGAIVASSVVLQVAGQLVNYADRLALATARGYADAIYWDPRHSPILDHVGTLVTYLSQPSAAGTPVPVSQSFDVWWLDLWRIDGVNATYTMAAGAMVGAATIFCIMKLCAALRHAVVFKQ